MDENEIARAVKAGELKCLENIAKHIPRQDTPGKLGVSSATAWQWIERGNLPLKEVSIDGKRFFYVSQDDQRKPDWNLQSKFDKRSRRGRPTTAELLGFEVEG